MPAVTYHYDKFPPATLDWPLLLPLIGPAHDAIARYAGVLHGIPNSAVLLSPLTTQEAVLSSRIEGTQATFGEVLEFEASGRSLTGDTEKVADIYEVINYRQALNHAARRLAELPFSQRLLRETHRELLQGVRGQNRAPGDYRRNDNWIGPLGSPKEQARFIPISADRLPDAMSNWERYAHDETGDRLVRLAILHAEFESIHPFLDGNGRIGRLLIPLYLVAIGKLTHPDFYVSAYLEAHRDEYYERLLAVSRDDAWTDWCAFFLTAFTVQAQDNQKKALAILDLYREKKDWIVEATHSQHAIRALDWFFCRPIFSSADFTNTAGIPRPTAKRIIHIARETGLLRDLHVGHGRRAAIVAFPELLNIAEGRAVF
jgi:Fic family protein